jgi:protein SCO1
MLHVLLLLAIPAVALGAVPPEGTGLTAGQKPAILREIGIDQRLDQELPADLAFRDETGRQVRLADYLEDGPIVLALVYYECPMLCTLTLQGLVSSLGVVSFDVGEEYQVVVVSIDPGETPELAAAKKATAVDRYDRPGTEGGWHFLTGDEASIGALAEAVGFRYVYDEESDLYAHAAGIMVVTRGGRLARYFYGADYPPRDVRLALVEASENRIGSVVDQMLLYCYQYDPATGKYGALIFRIVRLGAIATVLALVGFIVVMRLVERRRLRARTV